MRYLRMRRFLLTFEDDLISLHGKLPLPFKAVAEKKNENSLVLVPVTFDIINCLHYDYCSKLFSLKRD